MASSPRSPISENLFYVLSHPDYVFAGKIRGNVSIDNNLTKMNHTCLYRHSMSMIDTKISQRFWGTGEKGGFISRIQGNIGQILRENGEQRRYCIFFPLFPPGEQGNRYPLVVCWLKGKFGFNHANSEGSGA